MFIGHLGAAMAGKVVEPRASLGVLVAAAYGVDLLWPIFLLAGAESVSVVPLWPRGPEVGLGLWHSVAGTLAVEGLLFAAALFLYLRAFPLTRRGGRVGLTALVAVVALVWISGPFAPPPPGEKAVAFAGLALWILPLWAWRVEARQVGGSLGPASAEASAGAGTESPQKEPEPGR